MSFADAASWEQRANAVAAQKSRVLFFFHEGFADV